MIGFVLTAPFKILNVLTHGRNPSHLFCTAIKRADFWACTVLFHPCKNTLDQSDAPDFINNILTFIS